MPRLLFAVLACFAMLLPVGGCYRYDASAKNLTNQSVRVSLHKGRYQREISTAVLAPGASVGWNGAVNGPVFLRVAAAGESVDVGLPRRAYTELDVGTLDGELSIIKTVAGESCAIAAAYPGDCDGADCAEPLEAVEECPPDCEESCDGSALIEGEIAPVEAEIAVPDEADTLELNADDTMIDLIESDDS